MQQFPHNFQYYKNIEIFIRVHDIKKYNTLYIMDYLNKEYLNKITDLYKRQKKDDELEAIFYTLHDRTKSYYIQEQSFKRVLQNAVLLNKKSDRTQSLHVIYSKGSGTNYRIEVNGETSVKKYISLLKGRNKNVVFKSLLEMVGTDKTVVLVKKSKDEKSMINVDDYGVRFRMSNETEKISKAELEELSKIGYVDGKEIIFRYRERVSFHIIDNQDAKITLDLTDIKMENTLSKIPYSNGNYEIEVEIDKKKDKSNKYLKEMLRTVSFVLKVLQQSNVLISKYIKEEIMADYRKLVYGKNIRSRGLKTRKPVTLHISDALTHLPNKYTVTDKADGDRYFLFIKNGRGYMISTNLDVMDSGLDIDTTYNDCILDGEYIFLPEKRRYIYMAFDMLFYKGRDITKSTIIERLKLLEDTIKNCFGGKTVIKETDSTDLGELKQFYERQIDAYFDQMREDVDKTKGLLVRRKLYILPKGVSSEEIFLYASILWSKYTNSGKALYILDGLIFTPIYEGYISYYYNKKLKKVIGLKEYKWKPLLKLSIDFYIKLKRDSRTNKIEEIYDNTREGEGDLYNICYLYVNRKVKKEGYNVKDGDEPVEFLKSIDGHYTYLPLKNGYIKDEEGNIIRDSTVVEFVYDGANEDNFKWMPLKTREDKTLTVNRYKRSYGNHEKIAEDNWAEINNPITMEDFTLLADPKSFVSHKDKLSKKIEILSDDTYYEKQTNIALPMRRFHNWIKQNMIFMYCKPVIDNDKIMRKSVLDVAVGQGGDVPKYFNAGVSLLVGVDKDKRGIEKTSGAIDRYTTLKERGKITVQINSTKVTKEIQSKLPEMQFVQMDSGISYKLKDQKRTFPAMSSSYEKLIKEYFEKGYKFDVVNCQFAVHFFFDKKERLDTFFQNVVTHLKKDGYFMCTTFDAEKVFEKLQFKESYPISYTNKMGENIKLFEINKHYSQTRVEDIKIGAAIDVYNSIFNSKSMKEYLVNKDFIIPYLKERFGLICVETGLFEDIYEDNRSIFKRLIQTETNDRSKRYLSDIWSYYTSQTEIDKKCLEFTFLYRFYVFKKTGYDSENIIRNKKRSVVI
jgi:SAM-dependent methyltransferase